MKKLSLIAALGLALSLSACGDDDDNSGGGGNGGGNNAPSHLGGAPAAHGACDNPSDMSNSCYEYTGSTWANSLAEETCDSLRGNYSTEKGCTSTGRGGRCTLFADTANEYVAHCYNSTAQCETLCNAVEGEFEAN